MNNADPTLRFPSPDEIAEIYQFINAHQHEKPDCLRLKYHKVDKPWISIAINHIEAKSKAKFKLGELFPALVPVTLAAEQATSWQVARLHGRIAKEEAPATGSFVDMTCGLGIDCRAICGALGKGFSTTAIETNHLLTEAATFNFREAGLENITVVEADSTDWLKHYSGKRISLIFIDPARRGDAGQRVFNIHDCQPDVKALTGIFMEKADKVMVKLSPMLDVSQTLRDLPHTAALHIVDDGAECRELLAVLDFTDSPRPRGLDAEIIIHSKDSSLSYTLKENNELPVIPGNPHTSDWLFEPSPASMKGAPWGILCHRFRLQKVNVNTHLFVATQPVADLPGTWYEIEDVVEFSSKHIKSFATRWPKADVAVRNFPLKAEELAKRLKVKPGGGYRVIGATLSGANRTASQKNQALLVLRKA